MPEYVASSCLEIPKGWRTGSTRGKTYYINDVRKMTQWQQPYHEHDYCEGHWNSVYGQPPVYKKQSKCSWIYQKTLGSLEFPHACCACAFVTAVIVLTYCSCVDLDPAQGKSCTNDRVPAETGMWYQIGLCREGGGGGTKYKLNGVQDTDDNDEVNNPGVCKAAPDNPSNISWSDCTNETDCSQVILISSEDFPLLNANYFAILYATDDSIGELHIDTDWQTCTISFMGYTSTTNCAALSLLSSPPTSASARVHGPQSLEPKQPSFLHHARKLLKGGGGRTSGTQYSGGRSPSGTVTANAKDHRRQKPRYGHSSDKSAPARAAVAVGDAIYVSRRAGNYRNCTGQRSTSNAHGTRCRTETTAGTDMTKYELTKFRVRSPGSNQVLRFRVRSGTHICGGCTKGTGTGRKKLAQMMLSFREAECE